MTTKNIQDIVTEFFERNDCILCYGTEDKQRKRLTQILTHLQTQHEADKRELVERIEKAIITGANPRVAIQIEKAALNPQAPTSDVTKK